jgi:hypothetical protein
VRNSIFQTEVSLLEQFSQQAAGAPGKKYVALGENAGAPGTPFCS